MSTLPAEPMTPTFTGREELLARLDLAVKLPTSEQTTAAIQQTLVEMIGTGRLSLPDELKAPAADSYARRLVHKSAEHGYTIVAMVWGPQQGTALHDHDHVWCVEGVVQGQIEVVQYDLLEEDGDRFRFVSQNSIKAGVGSAGSLIPPFEYHTIANSMKDGESSVTLHIYAKELEKAHVFLASDDGWYTRTVRQLGYRN